MNIEGVQTITVTHRNPLPGQLDQYTFERHEGDQCFDVYLTPVSYQGDEAGQMYDRPHYPRRVMLTFEQLADAEPEKYEEWLGEIWEIGMAEF